MALEIENRDGLILLYFNAPPANGLSMEVSGELLEKLAQIRKQSAGVYAMIIASRVKDIFIAGADIKMIKRFMDGDDLTGNMILSNEKLQQAFNEIEDLPFPVIACIDGHAMGGGLELALACDFRFMAKGKARVGLPEVKLGLLPGAGGTQRLSRLIGTGRAKDVIYRSLFLDAQAALDIGIVNQIHESGEILGKCMAFAGEFKRRARVSITVIKECINKGSEVSLTEGLALEMKGLERLLNTSDAKEGIAAFLEKRAPVFKGK
jgi:enoyl-CoA hydratase/carnithine racemase